MCFDTYQRAVIAADVVVDLVFRVNSSLDIVADKQGRTSTDFVSRAHLLITYVKIICIIVLHVSRKPASLAVKYKMSYTSLSAVEVLNRNRGLILGYYLANMTGLT